MLFYYLNIASVGIKKIDGTRVDNNSGSEMFDFLNTILIIVIIVFIVFIIYKIYVYLTAKHLLNIIHKMQEIESDSNNKVISINISERNDKNEK